MTNRRLLANTSSRAAAIAMLASINVVSLNTHAESKQGHPVTGLGPNAAAFHADVEVDPTAYALDGYSLHVGLGWRRLRLDLGAFAMALPRFVHQQDAFDAAFDGYGAKLQYFPFAEQRGFFAGMDVGLSRVDVQLSGTDLCRRDRQLSAGVNLGYRISLPHNFYATPWLGIGYAFGGADVRLGEETFSRSPLVVFPAIHIGYHLR